MIDFDKALPYAEQKNRKPARERLPIHSGEGVHPGNFVGLTEPVDEKNEHEVCNVCKGTGRGAPRNGQPGAEGGCFKCGGHGKKIETKIRLVYEMESGITEQEEVNFKVTPPGVSKDGKTPISSSTLYDRFYALSKIRPTGTDTHVTAQQLTDWYKEKAGSPNGVRVPMFLCVGDDPKWPGFLKIETVKPRNTGASVAAQDKNNYDGHPSITHATQPVHATANGNGSARPAARPPSAAGGPNGASAIPANKFGQPPPTNGNRSAGHGQPPHAPEPAKQERRLFTGIDPHEDYPNQPGRNVEFAQGRIVHPYEQGWRDANKTDAGYEWVDGRLLEIVSPADLKYEPEIDRELTDAEIPF